MTWGSTLSSVRTTRIAGSAASLRICRSTAATRSLSPIRVRNLIPKSRRIFQTEADRLKRDASAAPTDAKLQKDADMAQRRAEVYKAQALFPKATRDYHAITLTLQKRLSNRFSILANYTYSRLLGNYPGPFSPYNNQLDPNISVQYDIIDLTVNRNGPLNNDRPHNFKATGFSSSRCLAARARLSPA